MFKTTHVQSVCYKPHVHSGHLFEALATRWQKVRTNFYQIKSTSLSLINCTSTADNRFVRHIMGIAKNWSVRHIMGITNNRSVHDTLWTLQTITKRRRDLSTLTSSETYVFPPSTSRTSKQPFLGFSGFMLDCSPFSFRSFSSFVACALGTSKVHTVNYW